MILSDEDLRRFNSRIYKTEGCWLWWNSVGKGQCLDKDGYGLITINGASYRAHRVSYTIHIGDPGKLHVLHKCDTPRCVNPEHLFLGTNEENVKDMLKKGRAKKAKGSAHGMSKLNELDAKVIKSRLALGHKPRDIHKDYPQVTEELIYAIRNGSAWSHINGD